MRRKRRRNARKNGWLSAILLVSLVAGLVIIFFPELRALWNFFAGFLRFLGGEPFQASIFGKDFLQALFILLSSFILYQFILVVFSQFILPSENALNRKDAYKYLRVFFKGTHGAIIRCNDRINSGKERTQHITKPTIALIGMNSALVVEKSKQKDHSKPRYLEPKSQTPATVRVCLPGLSFLSKGEVIRDFVDLRTQIRYANGIYADTWEKIKLKTDLYVIFSVGQPPEELLITHLEKDIHRIGVIVLSAQNISSGSPSKHRIVSNILAGDVLDSSDYHEASQKYRKWIDSSRLSETSIKLATRIDKLNASPYCYDPMRIQTAAVLEVTSKNAVKPLNWEELPLLIALDQFRTRLALTKYDDLYIPNQSSKNPLIEFKKSFSRDMQNQGVLAFRFIQKKNNDPFRIGDRWDESEYFSSELQVFSQPRILRNHGIRVIEAGFSELHPDDKVRRELIGYWKARIKKDSDLRKAESGIELDQLRIKTRNDAKSKFPTSFHPPINIDSSEDVVEFLSEYLDESMSSPMIRRQIPRETRNKLWELQKLLLRIRNQTRSSNTSPNTDENSPQQEVDDE